MPRRKPSKVVADAKHETTELAIAKAKNDVKKWRAKYRDAVDQSVELEQRLDAAMSIKFAASIKRPAKKARSRIVAMRNVKRSGVAAIAPATDWHVEERIFPEGVNGKNSFDIKEAEKRIRRFYQQILELIEHQNHLARVVELWHPLLGDLLTGYIHEELMETNELSPTEAVAFLQDMISDGVNLLLRETKLPIFIPTCVGNHGRTTIKKRIKTSFKNSYEWLLYKWLERSYASNSRVTFFVGEGYHNVQNVVGRKVRFHHGDGLRYNGGVGGITIPVNKSVAQWNTVDPVDLDVFGHWHTFLVNYPTWISCGSLMGYSEYSVEIKASFQHPTQTFIVLDSDYGVVEAKPIFLTDAWRKRQ